MKLSNIILRAITEGVRIEVKGRKPQAALTVRQEEYVTVDF